MNSSDSYAKLLLNHIRITVLGSLIAILPAVPFYIYTFEPTAEQLGILIPMGVIAFLSFTLIDILFISIYMRPIKAYLLDSTDGKTAAKAYKRALDVPTMAVARVFIPHALSANIVFQILIMTIGKSYHLQLAEYQVAIYWIANLTLVPISHAIFEFYRLPRIFVPLLERISTEHDVHAHRDEPRLGLAVKLFALLILLGLIPIGVLSLGSFFKAEKAIVSIKAEDLASSEVTPRLPSSTQINVEYSVRHDSVFARVRTHDGGTRLLVFPYSDVRQYSGATLRWLVVSSAVSFSIVIFLIAMLAGDIRRSTRTLMTALRQIKDGDLTAEVRMYGSDEFSVIGNGLNAMVDGLREREIIRDKFGKYFSEEVARLILDRDLSAEGKKVNATILFADLRNSTRLSSIYETYRFVEVLNRFLSALSDSVFENGGIVDKFIGDAVLGVFGTPIEHEDHATRAAESALLMRERVAELNSRLGLSENLEVGIGIHSGEVIVGNIGSLKKLEYTVVGETVNIASRLESLTKELGRDILVSQPTRSGLGEKFKCDDLGPVSVRGLPDRINVYHLVSKT